MEQKEKKLKIIIRSGGPKMTGNVQMLDLTGIFLP